MSTRLLLENCMFAEIFAALAILIFMFRKRVMGKFFFLVAFLVVMTTENLISVATLFFRKALGISAMLDYNIYATSHWVTTPIEYVLSVLVIYSVFREAMKPLSGLHRAGNIVFRWVCGVSLALVFGIAVGPHMSGATYVSTVSAQIQQGISVLTLCLLLFVCFATRYLGLTFRSHIFGISLGLGMWSTMSLVMTAWYSTSTSLYAPIYVFSALGSFAALATWGTYFALPEPERKMVLLPTTSPFFLWNRISEALGDEPGFVAVAGFKPDMLAPAELTMLKAGSQRMRERAAEDAEEFAHSGGMASYPQIAMQR